MLKAYSVSLRKSPLSCVSKSAVFLYNLTKNLPSQSVHPDCAVLPYEKITAPILERMRWIVFTKTYASSAKYLMVRTIWLV